MVHGNRSLRVALVVDQFPELSETFISGEARELARAGHAIRIEAVKRPRTPDPTAGEGREVHFASEDVRGDRVRALAWLVARHPLRSLRDRAGQRRWRGEERVMPLRALAPIARRVARARSEHIHAHFAAEAGLVAMRTGALLGIPYSVMTHGYDLFSAPANVREKHERAAFTVTASDYSRAFVCRELGDRVCARAHTLITGVDGQRFRRRAPQPGGRAIAAVGRLVEKKGFAFLIDAVALMRDAGRSPGAVIIAGDGPLRGELEARVAELGLERVVQFTGALEPAAVRDLLERADVLTMPCVVAADGDRDTMPIVVKEALAMEIPVVASDEVGLPEVVRDGWGRLVPPGDAAALAAALGDLLALPADERAAMGARGRAFVLESCSLERETARLAAFIAG